MMVCDDNVCTCGSTNVDFRSFENNFEANTFFYDENLAAQMKQMFIDDEQQAIALSSSQKFQNPNIITRIGESVARLFSPLL